MRVEEKKTFTNIQLSDEEWSLYRYIPNVERLKYYVGRMRNCMNMDHVMDHVVLPMLLHELEVTKENYAHSSSTYAARPARRCLSVSLD